MITHVVLFKFKEENKQANIRAAEERLRAMVGRVPSLRGLEVGRHGQVSPRSLDLALITRFDDLRGLMEYAVDPLHVEVKSFMASVTEASHVVDFESERS
jgi:hypothetical protein